MGEKRAPRKFSFNFNQLEYDSYFLVRMTMLDERSLSVDALLERQQEIDHQIKNLKQASFFLIFISKRKNKE